MGTSAPGVPARRTVRACTWCRTAPFAVRAPRDYHHRCGAAQQNRCRRNSRCAPARNTCTLPLKSDAVQKHDSPLQKNAVVRCKRTVMRCTARCNCNAACCSLYHLRFVLRVRSTCTYRWKSVAWKSCSKDLHHTCTHLHHARRMVAPE